MRNELSKVRKFFENTATRFLGVLADNIKKRKKLKHTKRKNRPRERRDSTSVDDVDQTYQNEISDALDNLHAALEMFLTAIRDFEDYSDRDGEESLENFMEQVGVRARYSRPVHVGGADTFMTGAIGVFVIFRCVNCIARPGWLMLIIYSYDRGRRRLT